MSDIKTHAINPNMVLPLFGAHDRNLKKIRERFNVRITHHDGELKVAGGEQEVADASEVFQRLKKLVERYGSVSSEDLIKVISQVTGDPIETAGGVMDIIQVGKSIRPRSEGQKIYVDAIRNFDIVFAHGPAGSGKTYLAVASAVEALKQKQIRKIVLVRPAVEAGESLGYLPGDLQAKINPYLRPLLDAIQEMIDYDQFQLLVEKDVIEVVPLAYMRGRTLNDAFIILDEAQNTSTSQMKMFLTRMGNNSKIVVSGDTTQIDLAAHVRSGMIDAMHRLKTIKGIGFVKLTNADIVRHRLVTEIVNAYDQSSNKSGKVESK